MFLVILQASLLINNVKSIKKNNILACFIYNFIIIKGAQLSKLLLNRLLLIYSFAIL